MIYKFRSEKLANLIKILQDWGYEVIGPVVRDGVILLSHIETVDDLPRGYVDEQSPGGYRLKRTQNDAYFSYVVGPESWKKFLYPPEILLFKASKSGDKVDYGTNDKNTVTLENRGKLAFLGVRSCDLNAIEVLDNVLLKGT